MLGKITIKYNTLDKFASSFNKDEKEQIYKFLNAIPTEAGNEYTTLVMTHIPPFLKFFRVYDSIDNRPSVRPNIIIISYTDYISYQGFWFEKLVRLGTGTTVLS